MHEVRVAVAGPRLHVEVLQAALRTYCGVSACASDGEAEVLVVLGTDWERPLTLWRQGRSREASGAVVLISDGNPIELIAARLLSVGGLVSQDDPHEVLLQAIHAVARGSRFESSHLRTPGDTDQSHRGADAALVVRLSVAERRLGWLLIEGLPYEEIALQLKVSEITAKRRVRALSQKLGFSCKAKLAEYLTRHPECLQPG